MPVVGGGGQVLEVLGEPWYAGSTMEIPWGPLGYWE